MSRGRICHTGFITDPVEQVITCFESRQRPDGVLAFRSTRIADLNYVQLVTKLTLPNTN